MDPLRFSPLYKKLMLIFFPLGICVFVVLCVMEHYMAAGLTLFFAVAAPGGIVHYSLIFKEYKERMRDRTERSLLMLGGLAFILVWCIRPFVYSGSTSPTQEEPLKNMQLRDEETVTK